jgi:hypothetical protein
MSNAPHATGPVSFESTKDPLAAEPPARADISDDTALVLAAVIRMEAALRDERATLGRMRTALGEMAHAIARTKARAANAEPPDTGALLDEFEHLVDAMIEIAGGAPTTVAAPPPSAPPSEQEWQVQDSGVQAAAVEEPNAPELDSAEAGWSEPDMDSSLEPETIAVIPAAAAPAGPPETVAEHDRVPTVSGVVLGLDPAREAPFDASQPADAANDGAPTVAMLKALVEALNASVPESTLEPEATEGAYASTETGSEREATVTPEPESIEASEPDTTVSDQAALLGPASRYREIIATPHTDPAQEVAAAAVFVEAANPENPDIEPFHGFEALQDMPAALPGDVVLHETDLLASFELIEARPLPPLDIGTAVIFPPRPEPATVTAAAPEPVAPPAPHPTPVAAPAPPAAVEDFLFGPEPEPDPAAFLLDPTPRPAVPEPTAAPEASVEPASAPPPPAENVTYDPLAPLKAMSDVEKIALFS